MRRQVKLIIGSIICLSVIGLVIVLTKKEYRLELVGDEEVVVDVFSGYSDPGYVLYLNDEVHDAEVEVESDLDIKVLGEYSLIYNFRKLSVSRSLTVVDTVAPVITLEKDKYQIYLGDKFEQPKYSAKDNYDGDLSDKVTVQGEVDVNKEGNYTLVYSVADSSGNEVSLKQAIVVKKKEVIVSKPGRPSGGGGGTSYNGACKVGDGVYFALPGSDNPLSAPKSPNNSKNEVICMTFVKDGISIEGVMDSGISTLGLMENNGSIVREIPQKSTDKVYSSIIKLTDIPNGTYSVVNVDNGRKLVNKIDWDRRIAQAKVGNKLVQVSYPGNTIQVKVSNFSYKYDIAINAGHGGSDGGSSNGKYIEKEMNLMVSLYEKKQFEAHGLRVYINRTSNGTYGEESGQAKWPRFRRSAYKMGEVASVSRFAYSNHHNSTTNRSKSGWEILVNARANASDLKVEKAVGNAWNKVFRKPVTGNTMYTKHYYTEKIFSKTKGQVYQFIDWYGMQRVTDMLFNEFVPTYEHIYLSNHDEVKWYMGNDTWKKISDAKVKVYVEALGMKYLGPR